LASLDFYLCLKFGESIVAPFFFCAQSPELTFDVIREQRPPTSPFRIIWPMTGNNPCYKQHHSFGRTENGAQESNQGGD